MDGKFVWRMGKGHSNHKSLCLKMDALVHDLSEALKDSSCASTSRVKVGFRRRTRSAGNIAALTNKATHSDDSISERLHSLEKDPAQSDSDEVSANSIRRLVPYPLIKRPPHSNFDASYIESDSVNENFSPLRTDRRKRKMKKMECDPVVGLSAPAPPLFPPATLPRRVLLPEPSSRVLSLPGPSGVRTCIKKKKSSKEVSLEAAMGKRKRSNRERSAEVESAGLLSASSRALRAQSDLQGDQMDIDREIASSSSLSSSESDPGLLTNDEGREGDDEQSDWFADPRPDDETDLEPDDPAFHSIFHGSLDQMSEEAKQAYSERIEWLRGGLGEREIRGGRRRVHDDRPAFSVLTSANEKLSRFLQDCQQITLRLHPMGKEECSLLAQLVQMYSLRMRVEVTPRGETCPVLSKTSSTPRTVRIDPAALHGSVHKKRRKLPHPGTGVTLSKEMMWEQPNVLPRDAQF